MLNLTRCITSKEALQVVDGSFSFEIVQIGRAQMLKKNIYKNQELEKYGIVVTIHFAWTFH